MVVVVVVVVVGVWSQNKILESQLGPQLRFVLRAPVGLVPLLPSTPGPQNPRTIGSQDPRTPESQDPRTKCHLFSWYLFVNIPKWLIQSCKYGQGKIEYFLIHIDRNHELVGRRMLKFQPQNHQNDPLSTKMSLILMISSSTYPEMTYMVLYGWSGGD